MDIGQHEPVAMSKTEALRFECVVDDAVSQICSGLNLGSLVRDRISSVVESVWTDGMLAGRRSDG